MAEKAESQEFSQEWFLSLSPEEQARFMNNFHGWGPEGFYRHYAEKLGENMQEMKERSERLIADFDAILEKRQIDPQKIISLREEWFSQTKRAAAAAKSEERREALRETGALARQKLARLLAPIFIDLVNKGYTPKELTI